MIAKRVMRRKATSDFAVLGRYILEAKNDQAAILWTRTAEYILDIRSQKQGKTGKVAWSRITNCEAEVPGMAIAEIMAVQAKNTRARGDKTYHLVISFPEGEQPSREQLEDIENRICEGLGYGEHQRLSAVHKDTDNLHIHLAISKIHPKTLRCIEPYYDHYRLNELCRELELRHGLQVDNRMGQSTLQGRPGDMEAHSGQKSLLGWIRETAGDALKSVQEEGQDWQALHQVLARFGLEIRPKGAGLVIKVMGDELAVKASSVDRGLSFKSLTERWGAYEAPNAQVQDIPVECRYEKAPKHGSGKTQALYAEYQRERNATLANRQESLMDARKEENNYIDCLKHWYQERYKALKENKSVSGISSKRQAYSDLALQRRSDLSKWKKQAAERRKSIREAKPMLTWQGFLQEAAVQGDSRALEILRSRKQSQRRLANAIFSAESMAEAKHIVFAHLHPKARKNGDMVYYLKSGGVVVDEAHQVRVKESTTAAVFLALTLADERFKGRALKVEGTDEFKQEVLLLAVKQGFEVKFSDPQMEQERQKLMLIGRSPEGYAQRLEEPQLKNYRGR